MVVGMYMVFVLMTSVVLPSCSSAPEPAGAPICHHTKCRYIEQKSEHHYYDVEGKTIKINSYSTSQPRRSLEMSCEGASVLDSPALPSFEPALNALTVNLQNCPLPISRSLMDSLATLNVIFCKHDEPCLLEFYTLPPEQTFTSILFIGLERLQKLQVINLKTTNARTERGYLAPLKNLRELTIRSIALQFLAAELNPLGLTLEKLWLHDAGIGRMPEGIYSSTSLQKVTITDDHNPVDMVSVPVGTTDMSLNSPAVSIRLDMAPLLQKLWIDNWAELSPPRLTHCDELGLLTLLSPKMHALPDKWLWNCSNLQGIYLSQAYNLFTLPANIFSPESRLSRIDLSRNALTTLQEGVFDNLQALEVLKLNNNHIKTLPRNLFKSFISSELSDVDLSYNDLDGTVLSVLEPLSQEKLTFLDLSQNPRIGDFCEANGYSPIRWFVHLRGLQLRETGVTRICTDWREEFTDLAQLDLTRSNISELTAEDLQFRRTVQAEVRVSTLNPQFAIRMTREEFNNAAIAPPSFAAVKIRAEMKCDCNMYWARRVLDHPLARLSLNGFRELRCAGSGLLRDVPPEDMVCDAREECGAASLQDGCVCAARPDDDPTRDRWLVRVRCENSTLGCVPRRIYPFYPTDKSNNQGAYVTQAIPSLG